MEEQPADNELVLNGCRVALCLQMAVVKELLLAKADPDFTTAELASTAYGEFNTEHRGTVAPWHRSTVASWHRDLVTP
jgi:hypothetical protein